MSPSALPPGFSYAHPIEVRWRDFDPLGHVNNAVYLTYLEAARIGYKQALLAGSEGDLAWVLAEVRCRYVSPIRMREPVVVYLGVERVGGSSLSFRYAIHAGQPERLAAEGEMVQVYVDSASGRPRPIPEAWRARLQAFERGEAAAAFSGEDEELP